MTVQIIRGNALNLPLEDNSVDLICTSPPYFGLRSYTDQGAHYDGQLGSEASPAEFVDALIAATREMVRVCKPSGSIFVNLGDKYAGSRMDGSNDNGSHGTLVTKHRAIPEGQKAPSKSSAGGIPTKSLMGLPWRYALRCIDDLGLILRAEIIWNKPNGLPESVTDRVRRSHEQWFHFVQMPRYYSAVDAIREAHVTADAVTRIRTSDYQQAMTGAMNGAGNPLGKLPGSVWTIPTQPLTVPAELGVDHFAAFPMEWPRRIIRGWSPSGICTVCGQGRRPVVEPTVAYAEKLARSADYRSQSQQGWGVNGGSQARFKWHPGQKSGETSERTITGEACGCETPTAPTQPAVILDPFGGTGTTALIAHALGRHGITIDMSHDYSRLAQWRCNDPAQLAAALQVDKPEPVAPNQLDLFETA